MTPSTSRAYLGGESRLVHLNASSLKLFSLVTSITYLLLLRFLTALICIFTLLPRSLKTHTASTESRIVRLIVSILQIDAGETQHSNTTSSSTAFRRGRPSRDEEFSDRSLPTGPTDEIIMPRESSLEFDGSTSEASYRQLDSITLTYRRPQGPRPPFRRGFENLRPSFVLTPPQSALIRRHRQGGGGGGTTVSAGFDGAASRTSIIDPIPRVLHPPIPTFISRMPYISVSDSIYSSSSAGLQCGRHRSSTSTSLEGKPPAKSQIYTDLLPKKAFTDSSDSPCLSTEKAGQAQSRSESLVQNTSLSSSSTFPGKFPISEALEFSSLATIAQQYINISNENPKKIRPFSAPAVR